MEVIKCFLNTVLSTDTVSSVIPHSKSMTESVLFVLFTDVETGYKWLQYMTISTQGSYTGHLQSSPQYESFSFKGLILSAHILNKANNFFTPYPQLAILDPNNMTPLSNKIFCKHPSIEKVNCAVCTSRFLLF